MPVLDPRQFLRTLVDSEIRTATGRPNRILRVEGDHVVVATSRSPEGRPVPIAWAIDAIDRLQREGEIEISVSSVGYRSAFIGAVLLQLPGAQLINTTPPRVRLRADSS